MSNDRVSREQESRAAESMADDFGDDSLLDTTNMPPREGFVQRWVRTTINNEDDQGNVFRSMNRGWKPRKADSVRAAGVPTINYEGANIIGIRGMILMERPQSMHDKEVAREKYISDNLMAGVKSTMHDVHQQGSGITRPEFTEQSSRVEKGRIAPVAPD